MSAVNLGQYHKLKVYFMNPSLTIGIATKNRAAELERCIRSLSALEVESYDVVIVDDGSDIPIEKQIRDKINAHNLDNVKFIRWDSSRNLMVARNEIVKQTKSDIVLMLDDDAYLLDGSQVELAINAMRNDIRIGAIAFPECDAAGQPKKKQPGKGTTPSFITHFYGYAHAVRRDLFIQIGGYREIFWFYHEESDLCKKMLNLGYRCLYWPRARIAHIPSNVDRSNRRLRRFKYGLRNRSLDAMFNEPFPLCLISILACCAKYAVKERKFRNNSGLNSTGGPLWLMKEIKTLLPKIKTDRKPLKWRVFAQWRWIRWRSKEYK